MRSLQHAIALYSLNPDGMHRGRIVVAVVPGPADKAKEEAQARAEVHHIHGVDAAGRYWFEDRDGRRYLLCVEGHE